MPKKESYKSADCCYDVDCYLLDCHENELCWGQVTVIAEDNNEDDYWWIHACEGHAECWYRGPYKAK